MLKKFGIENLADLDEGRPVLMVNKLLRTAAEDCVNRPALSKARKVTITLELKPECDEAGFASEVLVECHTKLSTPVSSSKTFSMKPRGRGELLHNELSEDNANQGTLDEPHLREEGGGSDA